MNEPEQKIKFKGQLALSDKSMVTVFVNISFNQLDTTSLEIELLIIADEKNLRGVYAKMNADSSNGFLIENEWDPGTYLQIEGIYGLRQHAGVLEVDANSISYGVKGRRIAAGDTLNLIAKFTPGGLLSKEIWRELHPDGNIKVRMSKFKDALWKTDIGTFIINKAHEHFKDTIFERKTTKSVEATHAHIEIKADKVIELDNIHEKALEYLGIISSALSLSFRVPVRLYELEYIVIEKETKTRTFFFPNIQRYKLLKNQKKIAKDPLIEIRTLSGRKFHNLASKIQDSNVSDALRKSIHFLSLSRTKYLEESYFYCFLALDSITEEVLKDRKIKTVIPNTPWKKIEKFLSACIKSNQTKELQEYLMEVKEKLPELKRYAFNKKASKVVKLLKVDTFGIWKKKTFEEGLKEATKIRNNLFHSGHIESFEGMYDNLIRLQFLTERIILKVLKWRKSQIWVWQDQELKGVNINEDQGQT